MILTFGEHQVTVPDDATRQVIADAINEQAPDHTATVVGVHVEITTPVWTPGTVGTITFPGVRDYEDPRDCWPLCGHRDVYSPEQVEAVLAFVVRGDFTFHELWVFVYSLNLGPTGYTAADLARRTIRRAKSERLIAWCSATQRYVALPPWRHRRRHDRRGWNWPIALSYGATLPT